MTRARRRQPIFVARSGRRARQVRRFGWIVGVVMLGYLGLVAAA